MHYVEIVRDTLLATVLGICGKKIYHRVKHWYDPKSIDIDNRHVDFLPQIADDEVIVVTEKGHVPKLYKFISKHN